MSCVISNGYTKGCDVPSGIRALIFINPADVLSMTKVGNKVTDLQLKINASAYRFRVEHSVTSFEETSIGTTENGSAGYEQKLTTRLHGNSDTLITLTDSLSKGRFFVITENNDGSYEMLFDDRGAKFSVKRMVEAPYEGFNGYELTATHKQATPRPIVEATVISSLPIN